jgi:3-hydroxybutyryl-CoA dehydratase
MIGVREIAAGHHAAPARLSDREQLPLERDGMHDSSLCDQGHMATAAASGSRSGGLLTNLGPDAVGLVFNTGERIVGRHEVRLFADLTGDRHPQHVDEQWAAKSSFGEPIAHGLLVVSFAMGLVPMDPRRVVALRRCEATFKRPIKLGDRIHVEGKLSAVKALDEHHLLASWRWRVVTDAQLLVVQLGIDILWRNLIEAPDDPHDPRLPGVVPL